MPKLNSTNQILTVSIIGSGNVATALGIALSNNGIRVLEVFSPNINNAKLLAEKIGCNYKESIEKLNTISDLYIIATPDNEISDVVAKLQDKDRIVAHTSGSRPLDIFSGKFQNYGVFYPLQTFTKDKQVDFLEIPICIEGSNDTTLELLVQLAKKISDNVVSINSGQRQYLHLTAVIVNNFTNLLYNIANEVLSDKDIDFSLLHPLIKETAKKIQDVDPHKAQTGPARRNEIKTINRHLELLDAYPEYKEVYNLLSMQIIKKYHG